MKYFFFAISLTFITQLAFGQGLPETAITLFDFNSENSPAFSNPKFLTGFNLNGYNNQPSFFENEVLYITSDWNAKGQTDIIKLNLTDESLTKVTDTDESEYSPTLTPDKQSFSTITVPPTEGSDAPQFLWNYPINQKDSGHAIDYDLTNVGYHIWLNSNELILFLVGDPHQLVHYNIESGTVSEIDKNVGRCFRLNHNNEVVYVHKAAHNIWYFKTFNVETDKRSIIGETKTGSEDFEILPDNSIIMGHKSKMYKLSPVGGWKEIDDLQKYGINNISRIAIRNNKIALVHASL